MTQKMQDLIKRAEQGDIESQYELGWAYRYGEDGFDEDEDEAFKWLGRAAKENHAKAQRHFASFYFSGFGRSIKEDTPEIAVAWLREAGSNGDAQALHQLMAVASVVGLVDDSGDVIIDCHELLVDKCNDPVGMVMLGAIYCGAPDGMYVKKHPKLRQTHYNPQKGFDLIYKGIEAAQASPENPLGYFHYMEAFNAHNYHSQLVFQEESAEDSFFAPANENVLVALAKEVGYLEKALAALKNNPAGKENVIPLSEQLLDSARKRLSSLLELYSSRESSYTFIQKLAGGNVQRGGKQSSHDFAHEILNAFEGQWEYEGTNIEVQVKNAFAKE